MPRFLVCQPIEGAPSVAPCEDDVNGVASAPVAMTLAAPGEVHFDNAEQLFAFGFSAVLIFYATGIGIGAILSLIRRGS